MHKALCCFCTQQMEMLNNQLNTKKKKKKNQVSLVKAGTAFI
jgi:hypothetical protein